MASKRTPGKPTAEYPAIARRTTVVGGPGVGVLVVSPLPAFIAALRGPFEVTGDLALGAGLTFEAAIGALRGVSPQICLIDSLTLATEREAVVGWQGHLSLIGLPWVLFGDYPVLIGERLAMEIGMAGYVVRPESGITFVARVRSALFRYR